MNLQISRLLFYQIMYKFALFIGISLFFIILKTVIKLLIKKFLLWFSAEIKIGSHIIDNVIIDLQKSVMIKREFFLVVAVLLQLYGCTTRTLTKRLEKKTLMFTTKECSVLYLNKSWKQHPTKQQSYDYKRSVSQTFQGEHGLLSTAKEAWTNS